MVRTPRSAADRRRVDEVELPEGAAHIIVVTNSLNAPAPDGYPDAGRLIYEPGDELPFEHGRRAFRGHAPMLAVLDEDGEVLAGAQRLRGSRAGLMDVIGGDGPDRDGRLQQVVDSWRRGEGFDPADYTAGSDSAVKG